MRTIEYEEIVPINYDGDVSEDDVGPFEEEDDDDDDA